MIQNIYSSDLLVYYGVLKDAWQLLDPSDKQNILKAVTLLQSLLQLKDLSEPLTSSENQKQKALIFAAEMMGYFYETFHRS